MGRRMGEGAHREGTTVVRDALHLLQCALRRCRDLLRGDCRHERAGAGCRLHAPSEDGHRQLRHEREHRRSPPATYDMRRPRTRRGRNPPCALRASHAQAAHEGNVGGPQHARVHGADPLDRRHRRPARRQPRPPRHPPPSVQQHRRPRGECAARERAHASALDRARCAAGVRRAEHAAARAVRAGRVALHGGGLAHRLALVLEAVRAAPRRHDARDDEPRA